jgi:hypothetical protein
VRRDGIIIIVEGKEGEMERGKGEGKEGEMDKGKGGSEEGRNYYYSGGKGKVRRERWKEERGKGEGKEGEMERGKGESEGKGKGKEGEMERGGVGEGRREAHMGTKQGRMFPCRLHSGHFPDMVLMACTS